MSTSVFLLPSDYETANTFWISDLNHLIIKWHKVNGRAVYPVKFICGRFERACLSSVAWQGIGVRRKPGDPIPTKEETHRQSSDYWVEEFMAGRLRWFGITEHIPVEFVDEENHCELV